MAIATTPLGRSYLHLDEIPLMLKRLEGYVAVPYADSRNIPTVGIGIALTNAARTGILAGNLALVLRKLGVFTASDASAPPGETPQQRTQRYQNVLNGFASIILNNPITSGGSPGNSPSEQALKALLDSQLATYVTGRSFSLTETESREVKLEYISGYTIGPFASTGAEAGLDLRISGLLVPAGQPVPHDTREYKALMSLYFNNPSLIGTGLRNALTNDDRAEAWYEIRYGSNRNSLAATPPSDANGIARRRYYEAEVFGLFSSSTVTQSDAEKAYRMLQLHRDVIQRYETRYSPQIAAGNSPGGYGLAPNEQIRALAATYDPARDQIVTDLKAKYASLASLNAADYVSTDIYLDAGRMASSQAVNPNNAATLDARRFVGGTEQIVKNILIGEGGDDTLIGGKGDDILIGGDGDDRYIWNTGDGNDRIIDSDRRGSIIINGTNQGPIFGGGYFKQVNPSTWESADGRLRLTHNSPWKLVTEDGSELELGDTFEDGDFGINLDDTDPEITPVREILGDVEPIDFDPPNQEYHTDDIGNLIVNPSVAALGRFDILRDSAQSDHIVSGGGSDLIDFDVSSPFGNGRGGNDWIQTGDGRDWVNSGSGDDLIEGGAGGPLAAIGGGVVIDSVGGDLLYGGGGDDRIFDDSEIDLDDAITAGNTASATGVRGDWLSGGAGDDILVAGAGNDVLAGGSGEDLLIGGAGDDNLLGDSNWVALSPNWTYHDEPAAPGERAGARVFEPVTGDTHPADDGGDTIYAGAGTDFVRGGHGNDLVYGEAGDDDIAGEWGNDFLFGGDGNDSIAGDATYITNDAEHGDDYLDGGAGNDELQGNGGADVLYGGDGDDRLFGDDNFVSAAFQGADYLDGGAGNDQLVGNGGDDILVGGAGEDQFLGGEGNDTIDGGTEHDIAFGDAGNDSIDVGAGDDYAEGGDGDDTILGGDGADTLKGQAGNDVIDGGEGNDFIEGGDGDDVLIGGGGADFLDGGAGSNTIVAAFDGDIILSGGAGNTLQLDFSGDLSALSVSLGVDQNNNTYLVLSDGSGQILIRDGFSGTISQFDVGAAELIDRRTIMRQAQAGALSLASGTGAQNLIGGRGNDTINGGAGADILEGNQGDDIYVVDDAGDTVVELAGEGTDLVQSSVTYTLGANVENLTLTGTDAIDGTGNELANVLTGNAAANTLDGAAGNDTLAGGLGGDTYRFGRGYGADRIEESDDGTNPIDRVVFAADTLPADVTVTRSGNDLVFTITGTTDVLTVAGYFTSLSSVVEEFHFDGGVVWDDETIGQKLSAGTEGDDNLTGSNGNDIINGLGGNDFITGLGGNDRIFGGAGSDTLSGDAGNDILDGGLGTDSLFGGFGADVYVFRRGDGADTITDSDDGTNAVDRIEFSADILPGDVTATRQQSNANNLVLTVNGGGGSVTVNGYFLNDATSTQLVEQIRLGDGTIWDVATIKAKVLEATAGNDLLVGFATDDVISGLGGNDTIAGAGGNDTLTGGTGNDSLDGGSGSDTYNYQLGDGIDTITNNDSATATTDRLIFGPGILPANISFSRGGSFSENLVIRATINQSTNTLVEINGYLNTLGSPGEIDEIRFADDPGTVWTVATVRSMLLVATEGADTLFGFETDDVIDGLGGNDTIRGLGGNDTLTGGAGNDTLSGGIGTDVLTGGAGNDTLYGEEQSQDTTAPQSGGDTLDGGAGRDSLFGKRGNDIYVFDRGYGHETIDESFQSDGFDTLRLKAGVLTTDVVMFRHGNDLVVTIAGDQAQAWVAQYFTQTDKPIEQIVFNDGTIWDAAAIASRVTPAPQNAFTGTAGNDTFIVDNVNDAITEAAGQGTDTVQSSVSYTTPLNVENLTLTGTLDITGFGNGQNNVITGNSGDNVLFGNAGNDTLNGGLGNDQLDGGTDVDSMSGGQGDDSYFVDNAGDTVNELAGQGIDTVTANYGFSSYTLGANIENLVVQTGFIFVVNIFGNELDNTITGRNTLNDFYDGGAGADTYIAPGGTFIVDNVGDRVFTSNSAYVKSKVDWNIAVGGGTDLELLIGTAATNGTGNAGNNFLMGNERANVLTGLDGNDTFFSGVDGNVFLGSETGFDTLIGGRGDDTYILADFRFVQTSSTIYNNSAGSINHDVIIENAGEGTDTVRSLYDYTLTDNVENLELLAYTLSNPPLAPVFATGNALNNRITGNLADNIIDGRGGADTMIGGQGNDTYYVDDVNDVVTESAGGGFSDTVISQVSYTLGQQVENLTLTGSGAISGTGNALANRIDGAQNSAANVLTGGAGDDTYFVGAGDTIVEVAGEGTDTVNSAVSYTLGANVENLVLTGSDATTGTGDALANTIDGAQNSAANTLAGGAGNDTYIVDGGDLIVENVDEGTDTVMAAFSYTLSDNLENLVLTGSAVSGTGNAGSNTITGNSFDNVLDGGGGGDVLIGSFGNDSYYIRDAGDTIVENFGEGIDTVYAATSYALTVGEIENLILIGGDAISGTGNDLGNLLDGSQNAAANVLSGGLGDDTYVLGEGDTIVENAGEGIDTVRSSVTTVLGAELENLELIGTGAISGFGNGLSNMLTGNDADNVLNGGAGDDLLFGGLGNDTYAFALGNGTDYFSDAGGTLDTIAFAVGITAANVSGSRADNDLILAFTGSSDLLILGGFYTSPDNEIERVTFADGTVWDGAMLKSIVSITGTAGADTLNGGSGDDRMFGLGGNDTLNGNAGNDYLDGGTGNDIMNGGTGNDTYIVDATNDQTNETSSTGGTDTVMSSVTRTLGNNLENLTLTGSGAISATGNTLANILHGDTNTGANQLSGMNGNDTYYVGAGDTVVEASSSGGTDTVFSVVNFTLGTNVEHLTLLGTGNLTATGNASANTLTGNAGNNTLNGLGGTDTMIGGAGDDIYVVDVSGDITTENANEGIDTIQTGITFSLNSAGRANIENLALTGSSAINATGNALNNVLTGNTGTNTLTGLAGNDTYILAGTTLDTVVEAANEGEDTVNSTIAITALAANVENLILTGTSAINGTGNGLNNLLRGNSAVNTLAGAAGNDILEGGGGNDILNDTGGSNLFNGQAGTDTLNGTAGNELLIGGAGNDTVNTGAGADIIGFNRGDGVDTVAISTAKDNSVTLGGGIRYSDLFFSKSGNNLILKTAGTGTTEQMTFTNWYAAAANRSVLNLQVVVEASADYNAGSSDALLNKKVARFNFDSLVNAFDAALVATPGLTNWALTNALLSVHLGGSDTAALGGDLAYRYGLQNNLAAVGSIGAQNVLGSAQFGTATQTFQTQSALESGALRLT